MEQLAYTDTEHRTVASLLFPAVAAVRAYGLDKHVALMRRRQDELFALRGLAAGEEHEDLLDQQEHGVDAGTADATLLQARCKCLTDVQAGQVFEMQRVQLIGLQQQRE